MDAENFWVMNKKDDAVKMSKEAIAKVTALEDGPVSADGPTQQAAFAAAKEVGGTCTACHKDLPRPDRGQDVLAQAGRDLDGLNSRSPTLNSQEPAPERRTLGSWKLGVGR